MNEHEHSFDRIFWLKLKISLIILYWILKLTLVCLEIAQFCGT